MQSAGTASSLQAAETQSGVRSGKGSFKESGAFSQEEQAGSTFRSQESAVKELISFQELGISHRDYI